MHQWIRLCVAALSLNAVVPTRNGSYGLQKPDVRCCKKIVGYLRLRRTERQKETICVLSRVTLMKSA